MKILNLLFPKNCGSTKESVLLLVARMVFGLMILMHGWQKISAFNDIAPRFLDPLGVGSEVSLTLAVFAEVACAISLIIGLLTRLALIPLMFTMIVAFATVHGASISEGELAFLYLCIFVLLFVAGAGKYSVDGFIACKLGRK